MCLLESRVIGEGVQFGEEVFPTFPNESCYKKKTLYYYRKSNDVLKAIVKEIKIQCIKLTEHECLKLLIANNQSAIVSRCIQLAPGST